MNHRCVIFPPGNGIVDIQVLKRMPSHTTMEAAQRGWVQPRQCVSIRSLTSKKPPGRAHMTISLMMWFDAAGGVN